MQAEIDAIETTYPDYDEYRYNLASIGHDPFALISYLSAVHTEFTAAGIESEIQELFDAMYSLTTEEVEETRTRTVTKTGTRTNNSRNKFPREEIDRIWTMQDDKYYQIVLMLLYNAPDFRIPVPEKVKCTPG